MQHLDEGTIHAWLDGALAPNEAIAAEAHVQTCESCSRAVAEARGLIAASSRILGALDDVPALPEVRTTTAPAGARRRGSWWNRAGVSYAAAAVVLLAAGTTIVFRTLAPNVAMDEASASLQFDSTTRQPDVSVLERVIPPATQPEAKSANERARTLQTGASLSKNAKEEEASKEELAVDRIVPLPGAMPRPAAAPPATEKQEARKALADAAGAAASDQRGIVQGRVLDAATGAPVAGATVSVDTARVATRTDNTGKFQLEAVPLGQQTISVRAPGFQQAQHQLAVQSRDSAQLGFALQKTVAAPAPVAGQPQRVQRDARSAASLDLADIRVNSAGILGCYTLRVDAASRDADKSDIALPSRIELEGRALERAQREEPIVNRARALAGAGKVESWRFVGDSLELTLSDGSRRRVLRFGRTDGRWVAPGMLLERCGDRPNE